MLAGSPPSAVEGTREAAIAWAATADPALLMPSPATNYRRRTNHAWPLVERGGQAEAGDWTSDDAARLEAIVTRAHGPGLWIRFYTINGHTALTGIRRRFSGASACSQRDQFGC